MGEQNHEGPGEDEPERSGPGGEAGDDPEEEAFSAHPGQFPPIRPPVDPAAFRIR